MATCYKGFMCDFVVFLEQKWHCLHQFYDVIVEGLKPALILSLKGKATLKQNSLKMKDILFPTILVQVS